MAMRHAVSAACGDVITKLLQLLLTPQSASCNRPHHHSSTTGIIPPPSSSAQLLLAVLTSTDAHFSGRLPVLAADALTAMTQAVSLLHMPVTEVASTLRQLTKDFVSARSTIETSLADNDCRTFDSHLIQPLDKKVLVLLTSLVRTIMTELSAAAATLMNSGSKVSFAYQAVPDGSEAGNSSQICSTGTATLLMQVTGWSCGMMRGALVQMTDISTTGGSTPCH